MGGRISGVLVSVVMAAVACGHEASPPVGAAPVEPASAGPTALHYDVRIDDDLTRLSAELCFDGSPPERLDTRHAAGEFLEHARRSDSGEDVPLRGDELLLGNLPPDACIEYAVSLTRIAEAGGRSRGARLGGDIVASPDLWMWRPARLAEGVEGTLRLHLPDGVQAAVPWPHVDGDPDTFRLPTVSFRWRAHVAFGRFAIDEIRVGKATFRIVVLDAGHAASQEGIRRWLRTAGESVALLYGKFPVAEVTLLVAPTSSWGADPVLFGHVTRGGGASILLLLDDEAEDEALPGEWVAIHEMLHLGMPYVDPRDAWLSEGFVTYYTQVLRARAGVMPGAPPSSDAQIQRALEIMDDGFTRARASARGRSLAEASQTMHQTHAYPRVYWGGAAIAFASDVALREASEGRASLDDAMREIQTLCTSPRVWRAAELLEHMGRPLTGLASGTSGPGPLREVVAKHLEATEMPGLESSFEAIGVGREAGEDALELRDLPAVSRRRRERIFGGLAE